MYFRKEINAIRAHSYLIGLIYSFETFVTRTCIFISIIMFLYFGQEMNAQKVFAITAIYNVLRPVITILFSISISSIAEVNISVIRIQNFLSLDETTTLDEDLISKNDEIKFSKNKRNIFEQDNESKLKAISNFEVKNTANEMKYTENGELRIATNVELKNTTNGELKTAANGELKNTGNGELKNTANGDMKIMSGGEVNAISLRDVNNISIGDLSNVKDDKEITLRDSPITSKLFLPKEPIISMKNVHARWSEEEEVTDETLKDINLTVTKGQLIAVIGPVGSGKSSLLNVLLKELTVFKGSVVVNGTISFSCQEPWLFNGSIRRNILFGRTYDEHVYKEVVKVCALESDFALFPYGDKTLVGEKGKTLSGGQKARINLARCVYKDADIYLLDDPLSAVDTNVGKQLYEECITKYLRNKVRILITHQLQYLRNADKILIFKEGSIVGQGTYTELQKSGLDFAKLLEEYQAEEEDAEKKKIRSRQNSEMAVNDDGEEQEIAKEQMETGTIKMSTYWNYWKSGGGFLMISVVVLSFILSQLSANAGDYFLTFW